MIKTDAQIRHLIDCQYHKFLADITDYPMHNHECDILNHVHVAYNHKDSVIVVDYTHTFPATCRHFADVRRAISKANML